MGKSKKTKKKKPKTWGEKYERALNLADLIYQEYLNRPQPFNNYTQKHHINLKDINADENEKHKSKKKKKEIVDLEWNEKHNYDYVKRLKKQWIAESKKFFSPDKMMIQIRPGKYIVTKHNGIQSRAGPSTNSVKVQYYHHHSILDIIKIDNFVSEFRVRGQIKDSLDWVSIMDTNDKFMWMEMELKPGKYFVTREGGIKSSLALSRHSIKIRLYPKHTTLELIKIRNFVSEQRIRGQIKDSLDWVSIKNTRDKFMWMHPIALEPKIDEPKIDEQYKPKTTKCEPKYQDVKIWYSKQ